MAIGRIVLGFFALASGGFCLFLALLFLRGLSNLASETILPRLVARQWPRAVGEIISAEVCTLDPDGAPSYAPIVRYTYSVGGHSYTQSQSDLALTASSPEQAQAVVARYPVGAVVTVYYDPRAPQHALIDLTIRPHHALSALFVSLGIPTLTWIGLSLLAGGLQLLR
jgi:hypothetical protein